MESSADMAAGGAGTSGRAVAPASMWLMWRTVTAPQAVCAGSHVTYKYTKRIGTKRRGAAVSFGLDPPIIVEAPRESVDPGLAGEGAAQGLVELGVAEAEPQRARALRDHALPVHDDVGHLPVERAHGEAGHRRDRGPVQRAAERLGERLVRHGRGRRRVDRPAPALAAVERSQVERDEVVDVDPAHVLRAAGHRPAAAELEEREHLRERAAVLVEHDAGADPDHAH